jgi:D-serine deaminase-like pyridoxal phosphate-dependent protein
VKLLPELRLNREALENNVQIMALWCRERGVELAPHIKTTMCRPIVDMQVAAGAWAVTVATVDQADVARSWGYRKILIANQVVDLIALRELRRWLEEDSSLQISCLVDSQKGLDQAVRAFSGGTRSLMLLLDVGAAGGRTGIRDPNEAHNLARQVSSAGSGVYLGGVSGYEGVALNNREVTTVNSVDDHCRRTASLFCELSPLFQTDNPVFTMGGSAFPDRVMQFLPEPSDLPGLITVLRSGCYVTHDHGTYARVSPIPALRPALSVRAVVLSTPEPGYAILGAGKRELPHDAGLPVLLAAQSADWSPRAATGVATAIFDHHLVVTSAGGLQVTDIVDLGISHPCSAFDKWADIVLTDDTGTALDVWHTQFHRSSTAK